MNRDREEIKQGVDATATTDPLVAYLSNPFPQNNHPPIDPPILDCVSLSTVTAPAAAQPAEAIVSPEMIQAIQSVIKQCNDRIAINRSSESATFIEDLNRILAFPMGCRTKSELSKHLTMAVQKFVCDPAFKGKTTWIDSIEPHLLRYCDPLQTIITNDKLEEEKNGSDVELSSFYESSVEDPSAAEKTPFVPLRKEAYAYAKNGHQDALQRAVAAQDIPAVIALIQAGFSLKSNPRTMNKDNPLILAAESRNGKLVIDMCNTLLETGRQNEETGYLSALARMMNRKQVTQRKEAVERLLALDKAVDHAVVFDTQEKKLRRHDSMGFTFLAAMQLDETPENKEIVQLLIHTGYPLAHDDGRWKPITFALSWNHFEFLDLTLQNLRFNADIRSCTTALKSILASENVPKEKRATLVHWLLSAGARDWEPTTQNDSALYQAVWLNDKDVLLALIKAGFGLHARETALKSAKQLDSDRLIDILEGDLQQCLAGLSQATQTGNFDALKNCLSPENQPHWEGTLCLNNNLYVALQNGHPHIAALLVSCGADLERANARDEAIVAVNPSVLKAAYRLAYTGEENLVAVAPLLSAIVKALGSYKAHSDESKIFMGALAAILTCQEDCNTQEMLTDALTEAVLAFTQHKGYETKNTYKKLIHPLLLPHCDQDRVAGLPPVPPKSWGDRVSHWATSSIPFLNSPHPPMHAMDAPGNASAPNGFNR